MSWGRGLALAVALLAMLAAGLWIGGHPSKMPPALRSVFVDTSGGLSAEATELIESNYYRRVSQGNLIDASLAGMVRSLRRRFHDRFSDYFSPAMLKRFNDEIEGRFSGIGLDVKRVRTGLLTVHVFRGSPAQRAGIRDGDIVVSVGGRSIAGLGSEAATELIRGPEGTSVEIGIVRPPGHRVRRLRLIRAAISLPVVSSRMETVAGHRLGYLRLETFSEGVHDAVRRAVRKLERRGARGLVLDLRDNGGGLLTEGVLTASVFLPPGAVVVSTDSRTQGHAVYRARGGNLPPLPLVVLINRDTASAAEILTAALADDAHATVVGTRSFGKGVFQEEIGLSNGSALKLTVGEYFTPNGTNLGGHGIHPDVFARDLPRTRRDEALRRALSVLAGQLR